MKILKWTPDFSVKEEPPVVPVWVSLEQLPLFLYARAPLFSIGKIIGTPLKIDAATQSLTRPSVARLCVEVDLRNPLPSRLWIGLPSVGFWQPITYDELPHYCFDCLSLGHLKADCGKPVTSLQPDRPKTVPQHKNRQVWRPMQPPTQPAPKQSTDDPSTSLHNTASLDPPPINGATKEVQQPVIPCSSGLSAADKDLVPTIPSAPPAANTIANPMLGAPPISDPSLEVTHSELPVTNIVDDTMIGLPVSPPNHPTTSPALTASPQCPMHSHEPAPAPAQSDSPRLVEVEVVSEGSSDSDEAQSESDGHMSDSALNSVGARQRKPYTRRNYGTSSMVTRSSVSLSPTHD